MEPVPIEEIRKARERIAGGAIRTPLLRLEADGAPAEIFLKLENLQPIGSFKIRGAGNFLESADPKRLEKGVWTASAGNMAQGVAWYARKLGLECTVVVPDQAPATKLAAIRRLGGKIIKVPHAEWFEIFRTRRHPGQEGLFVHAFSDPAVMAGNGTIGLEILEDLPEVDAVVVPFGGGGLFCGIAAAIGAMKPDVKMFACEVETAAPLSASLAAGTASTVEYLPSFVDGIGAPMVFPEMFSLARPFLEDSLVIGIQEVAAAVRLLVERNRIIAEGAGATPVAAALAGKAGRGRVVCVVSGGNLDPDKLAAILQGEVP